MNANFLIKRLCHTIFNFFSFVGSRRSEGRGSDGGFSGRGGANNSRWGNEPRGANNPTWHPENKFDYSRNNSTGKYCKKKNTLKLHALCMQCALCIW